MGGPQARTFRHVRELGGELVIVDEAHDVAHRLSAEAARVWRACDGRSAPAEVATAAGVDPETAEQVLVQLDALALLEPAAGEGLATRRSMLRRSVLAGVGVGVGLPVINSIVLPTAAQAFSSQPSMGPRDTPPPGSTPTTSVTSPSSSNHRPKPVHGSSQGTPTPLGGGSSSPTRGRRGTRASTRTHTRIAGGRSGAGAGAGGGSGATGAPLAKGSLPFTGSRLAQAAAAGAGMVAAGVGARRVAAKRTPPSA